MGKMKNDEGAREIGATITQVTNETGTDSWPVKIDRSGITDHRRRSCSVTEMASLGDLRHIRRLRICSSHAQSKTTSANTTASYSRPSVSAIWTDWPRPASMAAHERMSDYTS